MKNNSKVLREAARYVRKWGKILEVEDWEVTLAIADVPHGVEGSAAAVRRNHEHKIARVEIASDLTNDGPLEAIIIHELLHVVEEASGKDMAQEALLGSVAVALSEPERDVLSDILGSCNEPFIGVIARALYTLGGEKRGKRS